MLWIKTLLNKDFCADSIHLANSKKILFLYYDFYLEALLWGFFVEVNVGLRIGDT